MVALVHAGLAGRRGWTGGSNADASGLGWRGCSGPFGDGRMRGGSSHECRFQFSGVHSDCISVALGVRDQVCEQLGQSNVRSDRDARSGVYLCPDADRNIADGQQPGSHRDGEFRRR